MAKSSNVSAPPAPTPVPTPTPPPVNNDSAAEGATQFSVDEITANAADGTVPEGQGAGNLLPPADEIPTPTPTPVGNTGEEVQPEIGGEPIAQTAKEERVADEVPAPDLDADIAARNADMAEEAFETLKDEPFDPATNLGDWDGDGKAGGSAPAVEDKKIANMTNAELGTELGVAHAKQGHKPTRDKLRAFVDDNGDGTLPNGKTLDDEFWTAYDQAFDREEAQLAADELSDEQRLVRIEKTLGLLSPRD